MSGRHRATNEDVAEDRCPRSMRMVDIVAVWSTSSRNQIMKTLTYEALAVTRGGER